MLKRKISEDTYNALTDVIKAEYVKNGSEYVLEVDDAKDLINARDVEKRRADELKTERDALKTERDTLKAAGGDFTSLEASYKTRIAGLETQLGEANTTLNSERRTFHVTTLANDLAGKHFTVPDLIADRIAARLDLDPKDNKTIRVLDAAGKPSALTPELLVKEFVDNKSYAGIVKANQASGSAGKHLASGGNGSNLPFTPPINQDGTPKLVANMSPVEIKAHMAAKTAAATGGDQT